MPFLAIVSEPDRPDPKPKERKNGRRGEGAAQPQPGLPGHRPEDRCNAGGDAGGWMWLDVAGWLDGWTEVPVNSDEDEGTRGPEPRKRLKLDEPDWEDAVRKFVHKKKPPEGFPSEGDSEPSVPELDEGTEV